MSDTNPFNLLPLLERIDVDTNNQYFTSIDGVLYDKRMTKLIHYPSKNLQKIYIVPKSVRVFGKYAFYDHQTLETVVLQASLSLIDICSFVYVENVKIMLPYQTKINSIVNTTGYPSFLYDSSFVYYYNKIESKEICLFSSILRSFLASNIYVLIL